MNISEVYKIYLTPPNLKEHMVLVTRVALGLVDNWSGPKVDSHNLRVAALLHDLANIVKFDFEKHPEFLGSEQSRIDYWKQQQKIIKDKYGQDDHIATQKMLKEIGVSSEISKIIMSKSFGNAEEVSKLPSWEPKILLYSDMRVGPFGMVSMRERINDIVNRLEKYRTSHNLPNLIKSCEEIETQILKFSLSPNALKLFDITDEELLNTTI